MASSRATSGAQQPRIVGSSRATSSSAAAILGGTATTSSSASVAAGGLPPSTPSASKYSYRRKSSKPMSAKQLNKIQRNLVAVERSTRKQVSESGGTDGYRITEEEGAIDGEADAAAAAKSQQGDEQERHEEEYRLTREIIEETRIRAPKRSSIVDQLIGAKSYSNAYPSLRRGVAGGSSSSTKGGRGGTSSSDPALAESSFMHESSFVLNPLNRRATVPSPRKAPPSSNAASKQPAVPSASGRPSSKAGTNAGLEIDPDLPSLRGVDKTTQEALILEDILFALQGIEGEYIHFHPSYQPTNDAHALRGPRFIVDESLDPSLKDLVERILPLATNYISIFTFVELQSNLTFGTVAHALCSAIRDLLKEYEILVAQLEKQFHSSATFTLQKLWFYVHPTLRTLSLVQSFTSDIAEISHADILEEDEDDEDEDDEDEDEDGADIESNASLERQRRALLGLDDPDDEGIEGGVVKGGEILAMLWDRISRMNGDPAAHSLFQGLFRRASAPYQATLLRWISTGHLSDPYDEFIVLEDTRVTQDSLESDPTDEYWERRYTLRDESVLAAREQLRQQGLVGFDDDDEEDEQADPEGGAQAGGAAANPRGVLTGGARVPAFLEPWKQKILLAGKYLNVIRECGIDISGVDKADDAIGDQSGDEALDLSDPAFLKRIDRAYERANTTLLHLLITEQHIIERLRSVKHYFVMEKSDFFASFYEQSIRDLRRIISSGRAGSTPTRLGQQLGMVLGSSTTVGSDDPYKEDLRVECNSEKVYTQLMRIAETKGAIEAAKAAKQQKKDQTVQNLKVMDVLQFDIAVKFPVSLVISKKNTLRWQFLQRVILHLKILERQLGEMWLEHQERPWREIVRGHPPLQEWKRRIFRLRHSMTFVVQQVLAFITNEIIEPSWDDLENKMANAKTVDQFMRDHFDFLNTTRKEAMLTDFKYLTYHTRMTTVIEYFVDLRTHLRDQLHEERAQWETRKDTEVVALNPEILKFFDQVEKAWIKGVKNFRDCVILLSTTENPAATPLAHKLQAATLY